MRARPGIALGWLLILGGCVSAPTAQQMQEAYYGEPIALEDAEAKIRDIMADKLKDPESARYSCHLGGKGYIGSGMAWGGSDVFGYVVACDINAKNSFGAYAGAQRYGFVFVDGQLRRAAMFSGGAMQIIW